MLAGSAGFPAEIRSRSKISPVSFIDEGVGPLLDTLKERFDISGLLIETISWLGLKVDRRIPWKMDGTPKFMEPLFKLLRPRVGADTAVPNLS